jgi:hypothetical protein
MPGYAGAGSATLLRNDQQGILFSYNDGTIAAKTLSVAFLLERINRSFYPWGLSFEAQFSANPGAFDIDLLGANTDAPTNYVLMGSITTTNNAYNSDSTNFSGWVGRYDMASNLWPKYVAAYVKSLGNAVNISLIVNK